MTKTKVNPVPLEVFTEVRDLLGALAFQAPDKSYARLQQQDEADAEVFMKVLKSILKDG